MDDKMSAGMAEATRLTQAGKLVEATVLIQRTLQGTSAPQASSDSTDSPMDEAIDVAFQVIDAEPDRRLRDAARSPHESKRAAAKPTENRPNLGEGQHARNPKPLAHLVSTLRSQRVRRGESVAPSIPNRSQREVLAGGQFVDGSYANQAGTRDYKLYVPSGYRGQALPLLVMLHGCTQTPDDFAAGSRMNLLAERELFFVVYPAQATAANPSKCWNWFKPTDQYRDRGEPSIIAGITHQIANTYNVDERRVYAAGLSAGGAMAAILGMSYPDLYAAIGVHSGLAFGAACDLPSAFAAMKHGGEIPARQSAAQCTRIVPTIVFHGDRDPTVHQRNGDQVLAQWTAGDPGAGKNLRVSTTRQQVPNGHTYTCSIYQDASGYAVMEHWLIHGAGHAWSGGSPHSSFTDPKGPDASQEMIRFFYKHPQKVKGASHFCK